MMSTALVSLLALALLSYLVERWLMAGKRSRFARFACSVCLYGGYVWLGRSVRSADGMQGVWFTAGALLAYGLGILAARLQMLRRRKSQRL